MRICLLHNRDAQHLEEDPGRAAREDVVNVAAALETALSGKGNGKRNVVEPLAISGTSFGFLDRLRRFKPDLVVNLCESLVADSRGEMAIPCLLDLLGIPYTGSGALALGLALYKPKAKELLRGRGIATPDFRVVATPGQASAVDFPFPLIVKPSREDASAGIDFDSVVETRAALTRAVTAVIETFRQPALVERFVAGREIYVPLLGNSPRRALPLSEIRFGAAFVGKPHVVSYRAKWDTDSAECVDSPSVPCALDPALADKIVKTALAALECRDYGRVDLRLTPEGEPFVIDVNPNCDLHPEAGFARAALAAGMSYADLALSLVKISLERNHGNSSHRSQGPGRPRRAPQPDRNVLTGRGAVRPRAHRPRAHSE